MKKISIFTALLFIASLLNVSGAFAGHDKHDAKTHKAGHVVKKDKKDPAGKVNTRKHKGMNKKK